MCDRENLSFGRSLCKSNQMAKRRRLGTAFRKAGVVPVEANVVEQAKFPKEELAGLMTLNFQIFKDTQVVARRGRTR